MPLQQTTGNVTTDAYGGGVAAVPNYIEDVFSTYLYTGNGSTQTITNGIDLSTNGGLVWVKGRNETYYHRLASSPGPTLPNYLASNATDAASSGNGNISAFTTTGFTVNNNSGTGGTNSSGINYVGWTFRKQPKFFDVVTYTGDGNNNRLISHNLGSTPGCVIVKCTSAADAWAVWHRSLTSTQYSMALNTTAAQGNAQANQSFSFDGSVSMSSTQFVVSQESGNANSSGKTYVAYLFAHNAGGFGLTGTDNVISCGSYTASGSSGTVTLGYEPQWILIKNSDGGASGTANWVIVDNMRGMPVGSNDNVLYPNSSSAEVSSQRVAPTATGFSVSNASGNLWDNGAKYIYIAIRRGPMKVPTSGTSVFSPNAVSTDASAVTTNFPVDLSFESPRSGSSNIFAQDRLRGVNQVIYTYDTVAESTAAGSTSNFQSNTSVQPSIYGSGTSLIFWNFQRAPSFFDEVCYTGDSTLGRAIPHNLAAVPEFMIVKNRNNTENWVTYSAATGNTKRMILNTNAASSTRAIWANTTPTSTNFYVGGSGVLGETNFSSYTYVAYLFATCAGVSKVGSYTGNGSTQTINCGFGAGGARFVLIKRTDSTGDWYVYDTARGMTTLTDPYLLLNSTAAESATLGSVTTVSTGFAVNASILAAINTNAASYIFLAIA